MWEKSQLSCSWGCCSQPTRECTNHGNGLSGSHLSVLSGAQGKCALSCLFNPLLGNTQMRLSSYFKSPLCGDVGSFATVMWGVCTCPIHPFVLHGPSLVLRKCKKESNVQTRTAVVNRPHFMGTQYGSVWKPYLIRMVSIHPGSHPDSFESATCPLLRKTFCAGGSVSSSRLFLSGENGWSPRWGAVTLHQPFAQQRSQGPVAGMFP